MKLIWILIGLIAGSTSKMMTNPGHGGRWLVSLGVGVLGAVLLGWIGHQLGWLANFKYSNVLWPLIGSLISLFIYHKILTTSNKT